jgi:hypothetical protein
MDLSLEVFRRADCALRLCEIFGYVPAGDRDSLYGMMGTFPNAYDGTGHISLAEDVCTLEVAVVAAVWHSGIQTTDYNRLDVEGLLPFVSAEGVPWYGPDPSPRSIPFVHAALKVHLIDRNELSELRKPVTKARATSLLLAARLLSEAASATGGRASDEAWAFLSKAEDLEEFDSAARCVIVGRGYPPGPLPEILQSCLVLDLRGPAPRVLRHGGGRMGMGRQDYFPLGPLLTALDASVFVPEWSLDHQAQAVHGTVESCSSTVNAVGLWGTALSHRAGARVWGGFLDVGNRGGEDAQLVGLEIDVKNSAQPGEHPNHSKVGLQIVGMGPASNTNAIEVLASEGGQWANGILFASDSIAANGTIIGCSSAGPFGRGIDFAATQFVDSAVRLSTGSRVVWIDDSGQVGGIWAEGSGNSAKLVLQGGSGGIEFRDVNGSTLMCLPGGAVSGTAATGFEASRDAVAPSEVVISLIPEMPHLSMESIAASMDWASVGGLLPANLNVEASGVTVICHVELKSRSEAQARLAIASNWRKDPNSHVAEAWFTLASGWQLIHVACDALTPLRGKADLCAVDFIQVSLPSAIAVEDLIAFAVLRSGLPVEFEHD